MEEIISLLPDFIKAFGETLTMLVIGLVSSLLFGGTLGVFLFLWGHESLLPSPRLRFFLGGAVNIVRSFPFVILMIAVGPLARALTGTTIGPVAAAVPLSMAGIAYFSRLVELSLTDVPRGTIEAALSLGASTPKIVWSVLLVEARASLVLGFTSLCISYLSYSAAAGVIGGGGLGDLAIRFGYYRFQTNIMVLTVVGLILFVQVIQFLGNTISKKLDRR